MSILRLGILGYGVVGKGVIELINKNNDELYKRTNTKIVVTDISKRDWSNTEKPAGINCTTDSESIVKNPEIDVIIELIGGDKVPYDLVMLAINNGKHIVTANKALIAGKGDEIFKNAAKNNVDVSFEASVAGGVPIIKSIKDGLASNQITSIAGIINGTSNYILTAMRNENKTFSEALDEAQKLGYAEADPTFDVEGIDAAHKLTILASIGYGVPLDFSKLSIEGISDITGQDVSYAEELGYRIKHLGVAVAQCNGIEVRVHPTLIPESCLLSKVDGVMNAVRVYGNVVGETLFYGAGAGSLPTASAVVSDVLDLVKSINSKDINPLGYIYNSDNAKPVLSAEESISANYLRITVENKAGVLAKIATILAEQLISIEALIQKEPEQDSQEVPIIIMTKPVIEKTLQQAISKIESLETNKKNVFRIRVKHI